MLRLSVCARCKVLYQICRVYGNDLRVFCYFCIAPTVFIQYTDRYFISLVQSEELNHAHYFFYQNSDFKWLIGFK